MKKENDGITLTWNPKYVLFGNILSLGKEKD